MKSSFKISFVFLLTILALTSSAVGVTPVYAAGIVVNNNADDTLANLAGNTFCDLREAVEAANTNAAVDACASGTAGVDTITFHSSLSGGTIHLGSVLTLSSNITIDGSALASQISISGDGNVQVFSVSSGATVALNSLTITNGSVSGTPGGGGIYNPSGATLAIINSTLSNNTNSGGPGGGIRNDGTLTVTNSTFSGNTTTGAGSGGGIRNMGALTVTNSTFSGNSAASSGGGIYNVGGFISVMITNSTFSGNSAGSSGGGIYTAGGTFNYANTIIANSLSGGDCATDGTVGTNINNLVENAGCAATLSGDPALDSFANNGGSNKTFALIAGSSAIDSGDATTCAAAPVNNLDQRGITRPVGGQCDIGAYEGSVPDVVAPSVNTFTATSPSSSLSIPITAFTTSDNVAVTEFLITESSTQPGTGDSGWTNSLPVTYTVGNLGDYTLYPWAKDAAGNVSSVYGSPAAVTVCNASTTVTSNADSGAGTLRKAIADTCAGGTIDFNSGLSGGTIHLASTLILSKNVTIDGSTLASQITTSGDSDNDNTGDVEVFSVNSGVTATLNSLTITKGSNIFGGGIYVNSGSTLTITNSTLTGNTTTGGAGGGIKNDGTLTVMNSAFADNSAVGGSGGGIRSAGMLTVTNSTFSNNQTTGSGGGIYIFSGTATVTNSTFSGNQASSGSGIYNNGTLNYANTIIANSTSGGDCGSSGAIGTNINNLVEDNTCSPSLSGDPNLGSLVNNGGPTQTFALLTGSSAIGAGDNTVCDDNPGPNNLDQRGVIRPQGAQCDIGAYEYEYQSTVTNLTDTNDGTCDSDCSLREAIATAVSFQTITFDSSLSGGTIHLGSTLNIVQNMTIDGSALASKITVSGDTDSNGSADVRVFFIHSGMTVTLDSLIITKGNGTGTNIEDSTTGGGGIQNNSGNTSGVVLAVKNSVISDNSADTGGGIYNRDQSTITITNSTISGNTATGDGGGILSNGTLTVTGSTISGNSSGATSIGDGNEGGGGIRDGSTTTITNSTIYNNSANNGYGGGILNNGNLTAKNNTISGNSASTGKGGGTYSNNVFNATNNIIANSASGGDCAGGIDGNTNNLVEDGSCSSGATNFVTGDPMLDSLADNGGSTQTLALTVGSPAIDVGDDTVCANSPVNNLDQRGVTRPAGAHCDIGAFEGSKDISAPTVNSFIATSPSTSLNIPITAFTASDNVAVTGYKITESSTPPSAGAAGWTASAPSTYTVSSNGAYTLYPWVKDAAGNVSAIYGSPASVSVDATTPTVNIFSAPSSSASLNIPISVFTASDNVSVIGYKITESATPPSAGAGGWSGTAPTTYTVGSEGSYTLYPWAKDAVGNVSAVFGSPANVSVDATAPTINTFTAPSSSASLNISISTFTALDNVAVIGYKVTESATPPSAGAGGWSGTAPITYTVNSNGLYTLYPWAKDTAGNVSAVFGSPANVSVDATAPTVNTFTVPSSSTNLNIPISAFTASDNVAVIGYKITESATPPSAGAGGWSGTAQITYTVNSNGLYTLYPWAKDAVGNVSAVFGSPANVSVDATAPTVNTFTVPSSSTSLNIPISAFTASDNVAVIGYKITESATPPSAGAGGWSGAAQITYTVNSNGLYTLYPWAKDAVGNVSAVFGSPANVSVDTTAPTINTFTVPSSSTSLNIPISAFTASDNVAVIGYKITESATPPSAGAGGWSGTAPIIYTVGSEGSYTLYPWAKDAVGNVSTAFGSPASVNVDTTVPTVLSSTRVNSSPTNFVSVQFTVTFSESVTGVDAGDFSLATSGITGASVTSVSGLGATRTVTVDTGSGNGTIRLDVLDDNSIQDVAGNPLGGTFNSGEIYTIDKTVSLTIKSAGGQDGWILESSETSQVGGTMDAIATTFRLGDDVARKQYRGILSFSTGASLPNTAVITKVTLKVKKQGVIGGGNPVTLLKGFMVNIKKGVFGASALAISDFQSPASKSYGPFKPSAVSNWYSIDLTGGKAFINKLTTSGGLTQIRLSFKLDDNNDSIANYLSLYSGNASKADRPQLIVEYYVP